MYIRYSYAQICNIVTAIVFSNFISHFRMANVFVNTKHAWHVFISMRTRILFMSTLFTNISFHFAKRYRYIDIDVDVDADFNASRRHKCTNMYTKLNTNYCGHTFKNLNAISIPIRDVCYCISFSILIVTFNFIECSISEFDTAFDTNFD